MERLNAETDIRHKRRALMPDEFARLVDAARNSGVEVQGYDGEMRARIYQISYLTGLRRSELASLTPNSFRLDDVQPTLTVDAACSKHRRKDVLPMHPELVTLVRGWITGLGPDEPLFFRLARRKTYTMVQKDLERAGIPTKPMRGWPTSMRRGATATSRGWSGRGRRSWRPRNLPVMPTFARPPSTPILAWRTGQWLWRLFRSRWPQRWSRRWSRTQTFRGWSPPGRDCLWKSGGRSGSWPPLDQQISDFRWLHIGCIWGGVLSQELSAGVSSKG